MSAPSPLLGAYGVTYSYDGRSRILEDVSLEVDKGDVVALLGPNGSGKSTFLKYAAGILPRAKGSEGIVKAGGFDLFSLDQRDRARKVVYVGGDLKPEFPIRAIDAVWLGRGCHQAGLLQRAPREDAERVRRAMDESGCWHLRERDLSSLSGGERSRVAVARALAQDAKVLLLDEALSPMDLDQQAVAGRLLVRLAEQGYGIVLVAHDVNLASEWATSCLLLDRGKSLGRGPIAEVLHGERFRRLYPEAEMVAGTNPATGKPKVFFGPARSRESSRPSERSRS